MPCLGGFFVPETSGRTSPPASGLRGLQCKALEVCLAFVLSTLGAFGRGELSLGVYLTFELVEHGLARVRGSGRSVLGVGP